jgi:hypothetical protein
VKLDELLQESVVDVNLADVKIKDIGDMELIQPLPPGESFAPRERSSLISLTQGHFQRLESTS